MELFVLIIFLLCVSRAFDGVCGCVIGLAKLVIFGWIAIIVLIIVFAIGGKDEHHNTASVVRASPVPVLVAPSQDEELEPPIVTKTKICRRRGGDFDKCIKS